MVKVSIKVMSQCDVLAKRGWSIGGQYLRDFTTDCMSPIKYLDREARVIGFSSADMNHGIFHLEQIAIDALDVNKVATMGQGTEARECHDSSGEIKASNGDGPLQGTNE
jgi:hypothetical protein